MSRKIDIGAAADFADGAMKAVEVEGRDLLIARVGDHFYAADERCPHLGGHLARGSLEGTVVQCPLHGSRFDLVDGSVLRWTKASGLMLKLGKLFKPEKALKTHQAAVEEGRLLVEVD